jgi:hypothetical protein
MHSTHQLAAWKMLLMFFALFMTSSSWVIAIRDTVNHMQHHGCTPYTPRYTVYRPCLFSCNMGTLPVHTPYTPRGHPVCIWHKGKFSQWTSPYIPLPSLYTPFTASHTRLFVFMRLVRPCRTPYGLHFSPPCQPHIRRQSY